MFHFKNSAFLALVLFCVACVPEGELGMLTAPLTALDGEIDAFARSQDELQSRSDVAADRSDLTRETDRFQSDARRHIQRMFDRIDEVGRCGRDGAAAPTDRLVRDVSDLSDLSSALTDFVRDAGTDPLAHDRVTDFVRISDRILDAIEDDVSDLRERADEFRCGTEPYRCTDNLSDEECRAGDRVSDQRADAASRERSFDGLDAAIRALDRAQEVIVVVCESLSDRGDLLRVIDAFRSDATRRLERIDAARDAVRDQVRDTGGPTSNAIDQAFDALETAVDSFGGRIDQSTELDTAREELLDELRTVDQRIDDLSRASSDTRDDLRGCDDDPNTDDC